MSLGGDTLLSWNIRGLADATKRQAMFSFLRLHRPLLVFLQETHLTQETRLLLRNRNYPTQFHAFHSTHSRGVSILVSGGANFVCHSSKIDMGGRYVFLYGTLFGIQLILACVYAPPPHDHQVMREFALFSANRPEVPVLMLGDFNTVLCPQLDRRDSLGQMGGAGDSPFAKYIEETTPERPCLLLFLQNSSNIIKNRHGVGFVCNSTIHRLYCIPLTRHLRPLSPASDIARSPSCQT